MCIKKINNSIWILNLFRLNKCILGSTKYIVECIFYRSQFVRLSVFTSGGG